MHIANGAALMSGVPVVDDRHLAQQSVPASRVVPATKTGELMTRIMIDVHSDDPKALVAKIDEFCATSDEEPASAKARACALGHEEYSMEAVKRLWEAVLRK
jgi:hypothetical protein